MKSIIKKALLLTLLSLISLNIAEAYVFPSNLKLGSRGEEVKNLQILLNQDKDTQIATSGAGSPNNETTYFGPATVRAVIKFQNKYKQETLNPIGLTKGTGFVGALTRKKLSTMGTSGTSGTLGTPTTSCTTKYDPKTGKLCVPTTSTAVQTCLTKYDPKTGKLCSQITGTSSSSVTPSSITSNIISSTPAYSFSGGGGGGGYTTPSTSQTQTPTPTNGGWSAYGTCSVTACGTTGNRVRTCNNPTPLNGGAYCSGTSSETCSAPACGVNTYTLTATAGANGVISPLGGTTVSQGGSQTYTITPNTGYQLATLTIGGGPVSPVSSYTFTNVQGDNTINATFSAVTVTYTMTYYVDYDNGSDSNAGTISSPFKHSPTDPNSTGNAVVTLVPGNRVCFKGGVIYRGTPKPKVAGTSGAPIIWDGECSGFGSGKAIIDGSEVLNGCTSGAMVNGHQSYSCPIPAGLPTASVPHALNLYQGEQRMIIAQATPVANYYSTDNIAEYFSIPIGAAVRTVSDTRVTDAINITPHLSNYLNSFLKIWVYGNRIETLAITGVDVPNNTIIAERAKNAPYTNFDTKYTVINNLVALDTPGEYFVDTTNNTITLIPHSSFDPNNSNVTYSKRQDVFDIQASYNTVKNMIVQKGAAGVAQYRHNGGIRVYNGNTSPSSRYTGIIIDNIEARYSNSLEGYGAIYVEHANDTIIKNCYVHHVAPNRGITVSSSDNVIVENNEVTAVDGTGIYFGVVNYGRIIHNYVHDNASIHGNGITTYQSSNNNIIAYNRVINSQIAYTTQASSNNTIAFNLFSTPLATNAQTVAGWSNPGTSNLKFYNNIILNGKSGSGFYVSPDSAGGLIFKNNIVDGSSGVVGSGASNNIYTSLVWNQTPAYGWYLGSGESNATYSQLFVDANNGDYRPKANSPSINAGVDMSSYSLLEDILGVSLVGKIWDIGAYEYIP